MQMYVCVKDGRALRVIKNSVYAEQMTDGQPYQIWACDEWSCPDCDYRILVSAPQSCAQHWDTERWAGYANRTEVMFR